jgi:hypothetical protein
MALTSPSTSSLTRGAKRLKQLGSDAISIPSTQELYDRKCADLAQAKQKLASIVARQIQAEKTVNGKTGYVAPILAEKAAAKATVARLENECGLLKGEIVAARPAKPLSAWAQAWSDAASHDPYAHIERGSAEQIASAQADVDALVRDNKINPPTMGSANEVWSAKYRAAHLRLAVLQGLPYSARTLRFFTREELAAARAKEGLK